MKNALIIVGILTVALAGIGGLSASLENSAVAPELSLRPCNADGSFTGWCQSLLNELVPSLRSPVQLAEEEEAAAEEEKEEEFPELPDRIWSAVQLG
jgi:hypothetical protein